jgi:uncharacterized repeat protein (TIGR03803 family)
LASDGNFYGTTENGGSFNSGTVFRLSATGAVKIVYSFDGHTNGGNPNGPVVQGRDGFLYGTTTGGGLVSNPVGVVFKLSTKGVITVLHSFDAGNLADGKSPYAGLVAATDGSFYGASGGSQGGKAQYGALFKITKSGSYSVLHLFDNTHGKSQSATSLQHTSGILYGLPDSGGVFNGGVFYSLAAGIPPFVSLGLRVGKIGTTLGILGQGFTTATAVTFNQTAAKFTVVSDNYLTATIPTGATKGYVTVTEPSGTLKSNLKFTPKP